MFLWVDKNLFLIFRYGFCNVVIIWHLIMYFSWGFENGTWIRYRLHNGRILTTWTWSHFLTLSTTLIFSTSSEICNPGKVARTWAVRISSVSQLHSIERILLKWFHVRLSGCPSLHFIIHTGLFHLPGILDRSQAKMTDSCTSNTSLSDENNFPEFLLLILQWFRKKYNLLNCYYFGIGISW